jgi:hypothetical protein
MKGSNHTYKLLSCIPYELPVAAERKTCLTSSLLPNGGFSEENILVLNYASRENSTMNLKIVSTEDGSFLMGPTYEICQACFDRLTASNASV